MGSARSTSALVLTLALALALAGTGASSTASTPAQRVAEDGYRLVSPSGNISCGALVYGPRDGAMRCTLERSAKSVPRPASAQCDWEGGRLYSLGAHGAGARASFCDALPVTKPPIRLGYGRVWHRGPFTCLSSRIALLCTNADGHGLLLSFEAQRAF